MLVDEPPVKLQGEAFDNNRLLCLFDAQPANNMAHATPDSNDDLMDMFLIVQIYSVLITSPAMLVQSRYRQATDRPFNQFILKGGILCHN